MTDNTRYALVDASGKVLNVTNIGLVFEEKYTVSGDGLSFTKENVQVDTTILPVTNMIVPGDKYVNGKFVKATDNTTHHAVIRNRDGVIMHFVDFPDEVIQVVPDFDEASGPGMTWDGGKFIAPVVASAA